MNWKNRLTNYNFWISIFSAVLLILQALKIEFDIAYVNEIFTAVLGLLVVIGIISDPTRTTVKTADSGIKEKTEQVKESKTEEIKPEEAKEVRTENNSTSETLPNEQENETNNINVENDFQTILNKISSDLDEKMFVLNEKMKEIENFQLKNIETVEKVGVEDGVEVKPAVADMNNPYIDTIN